MLIIGLTGGIACGKSTAAQYFKELGVPVIDADTVALELTSSHPEIQKQIIAYFGKTIVNDNNHLQRKKLREIIFADEQKRLWLEELLHPLILDSIQQKTSILSAPYCIWMIPLLIEKNITVDRILVIDCSEHTQMKRLQQRDQMSSEQIHIALQIQVSRADRLVQADDIIENNGSLDELKQKVLQQHKKYLELAAK